MQCLSPLSIKDPRGDNNRQRLTVPCGKCYACLATRRDGWSFRLNQEVKRSSAAHFITLTYSDENLSENEAGYPVVKKKDVQDWLKRLRRAIEPFKVRYFLVSEYGGITYRPHYHLILFNFPDLFVLNDVLESTWTLGHFHVGQVTGASIHYCTKYSLANSDLPDSLSQNLPFMLCSRKPGIGSNYLTPNILRWHRQGVKTFVIDGGFTKLMPRYYRNKVFTSEYAKGLIMCRSIDRQNENEARYDKRYGSYDQNAVNDGLPTMISQQKESFVKKSIKECKTKKS